MNFPIDHTDALVSKKLRVEPRTLTRNFSAIKLDANLAKVFGLELIRRALPQSVRPVSRLSKASCIDLRDFKRLPGYRIALRGWSGLE